MATEYAESVNEVELGMENLIIGFFCGTLAGALFGSMMAATPMMANIGALLGEGPNVGWGLHIVASAVFGSVYAVIASIGAFERYASSILTGTLMAAIYGIALWLVGGSLLIPAVFDGAVVFEVDGLSFLGFLIYGGLIGAGFATALHASVPLLPTSKGE